MNKMENKSRNNKENTGRKFLIYLAILVTAISFANIALAEIFGNYGKLRSNKSVTSMLEKGEVNSNMTLFIFTVEYKDSPRGIIGIDKSRKLVSQFWEEVPDPTPEMIKKFVNNMKEKTFLTKSRIYGCDILDNNGDVIGFWFSSTKRGVVEIEENNEVVVHTPVLHSSRWWFRW